MTIDKNLKDGVLTVALAGRLDTTTAPELESSIQESISDVKDLIFNFGELEYISSAGLRVLLSTQKIMSKQGSMIVKNVSEPVMEVFEVTGFSDILTIETAENTETSEG
ncbi:MAG: STAS domain-containing protein [Firmicutes bacterium]|nr:STAS domain-containing protein [Bacillota bacterium]